MNLKHILLFAALTGAAWLSTEARNNFTPGQSWNDVSGSHINAHGCCVVYYEGTYYWFGEDRTGSVSNGVSCYTSTNLYDWKRKGLVFKTSQALDENTGKAILERPKVVYNQHTGKWVMYCHWENGEGYGLARVCVSVADRIDGNYEFISTFRPNEHDSRDQTVVVAPDGKGYHICATGMNTDINIALLSPDFLTTEKNPVTEIQILKMQRLEAPAVLRVDDTYFCLFSECSGWDPNPGHCAYATEILGTWQEGPNFALDAGSNTTYKSQSTYVLPVEGKPGAYIYMGDRWNKNNVGASEYVWLPLSVRSGYPTVKWYDSWDLSIFDDADRFARIDLPVDGAELRILDKFSDRWMSTRGNGFFISDDNDDVNLTFRFEATENPYRWRIADTATGMYLESTYGSLKLAASSDDIAQLWRLELLDDGSYRLESCQSGKVLTVAGSSQLAGTSLFMSTPGATEAQRFGLYFDKTAHADYQAADMFAKEYFATVAERMAEQDEYEASGVAAVDADEHISLDCVGGELILGGLKARVYVDDMAGRIAAQCELSAGSSFKPELAPGVYVATAVADGATATLKFTVR